MAETVEPVLSETKIVGEVKWGGKLRARLTLEHFELSDVGMVGIEQKMLEMTNDIGGWGVASLSDSDKARLQAMLAIKG